MGFFDETGKYVRDGEPVALKLPIGFGTADAAPLWKVPEGARIQVDKLWWEVITAFTGGSSSAIGVSASPTGFDTKGDLLGGATGDVLATLTAGSKGGTIGAAFASNGLILLNAAAIIRFDRITSAFTAGAGFVHLRGWQIK